jgi:hypothetical protein
MLNIFATLVIASRAKMQHFFNATKGKLSYSTVFHYYIILSQQSQFCFSSGENLSILSVTILFNRKSGK